MVRVDMRAALILLLTVFVALGLLTFGNFPGFAESFDGRRAVIVDGARESFGGGAVSPLGRILISYGFPLLDFLCCRLPSLD
jgi:hypothetical protein